MYLFLFLFYWAFQKGSHFFHLKPLNEFLKPLCKRGEINRVPFIKIKHPASEDENEMANDVWLESVAVVCITY